MPSRRLLSSREPSCPQIVEKRRASSRCSGKTARRGARPVILAAQASAASLRATRGTSIPRAPTAERKFRDRGAVDEIAVGRAWASAASLRATRGTALHYAPTAERSHCMATGTQLRPHEFRSRAKRARPMARTLIEVYLHITLLGTEDATAPRSGRYGGRFRGSRVGSLRSPPRDPRLFHRPLRGRGFHRSTVAEWIAARWRNSPLRGLGVMVSRSAVAESIAQQSPNG